MGSTVEAGHAEEEVEAEASVVRVSEAGSAEEVDGVTLVGRVTEAGSAEEEVDDVALVGRAEMPTPTPARILPEVPADVVVFDEHDFIHTQKKRKLELQVLEAALEAENARAAYNKYMLEKEKAK